MSFDDSIIALGEFGRYQWLVYLVLCIAILMTAPSTLSTVFIAPETEHWCASWSTEDCSQWALSGDNCTIAKRNVSIPRIYDNDGSFTGYDQCMKYDTTNITFHPQLNLNGTSMTCDQGWVYMSGREERTLINEFKLVCSKATYPEIAQSLYFVGLLCGSLGFGALSDRIGRVKTLFIAMLLGGTSGIVSGLVPNFWFYVAIRAIYGSAIIGFTLSIFVFFSEIVGPTKRAIAGNFLWVFFALGYGLLAGMAYVFPHWRVLTIVVAIPFLLLVPFYMVIPESPRWLVVKGRYKEAEIIMRKMAAFNNKSLPLNFMQGIIDEKEQHSYKEGRFLDLLKSSIMRWRILNLMFNWAVQSLVYYGLSLSTSDLGVNNYVAFCISGLVEIPAYFCCMYIPDIIGRRFSITSTMVVGGMACIITIFIPPGFLRTAVAMVGKFGITASFALVYLFSVELLPTPFRNAGLGACSVTSRLGGIISPMILLLRNLWEPLPLIIFGLSSLVAGLLALLLPESKGVPLPQTIEEAENMGKKIIPLQEEKNQPEMTKLATA